ncbi:peptidylprolyl isomerase [Kangiella koreensis]|uniref:peptidylprolyl isomerase n=1 Tax=Kangiella koreensis (strain DSM 16069 / JCM 12317 / KCTC 12182 / SW-125) TaxID=523791 RepID=C7R769_KANKD|nr:peptidylprolyl isomerase [Kangiella koreensis]ACV27525.1 peptidyl-prolyl cis-trans isomerase cyclophilin type [Kangiella koreensis DSM 16069]
MRILHCLTALSHHSKLAKPLSLAFFTLFFAGCSVLTPKAAPCVETQVLYRLADMRQINETAFNKALACDNLETVQLALINLGRIGDEQASNLILPLLKHSNARVRETAAFALGISLHKPATPNLIEQLEQEKNSKVRAAIVLAIGNLGGDQSVHTLARLIENTEDAQVANAAMQGLGIMSVFHRHLLTGDTEIEVARVIDRLRDEETALKASFLLARVPLLRDPHVPDVIALLRDKNNSLDSATQAFMIRALSRLGHKDITPFLWEKVGGENNAIQIAAAQALGIRTLTSADQIQALNDLALKESPALQVTVLQSARRWMTPQTLKALRESDNSWVQSAAFLATNDKAQPEVQKLVKAWLESDDPNHQRAVIQYFVELDMPPVLKQLAESDKAIIRIGAQRALNTYQEPKTEPQATPAELPDLLEKGAAKVKLTTTQGDIVIRLFKDTPYTSANFLRLAESGFYENTYFHRVIPNFVAQGGSQLGDGSGSVGYSIREELNQRSHLKGTIGMATAGKDTGGAQFFFNLAPNLHLDSNYTVFAEVVEGMDIVMSLEQNDQILKAEIIK